MSQIQDRFLAVLSDSPQLRKFVGETGSDHQAARLLLRFGEKLLDYVILIRSDDPTVKQLKKENREMYAVAQKIVTADLKKLAGAIGKEKVLVIVREQAKANPGRGYASVKRLLGLPRV